MRWLSVTLTVLATSVGIASAAAGPTQCIAFDIYWNLFTFGFRGRDYNTGRQESWGTSGSAKDITTNGRPPFDQRCARSDFEGQYTNAIYVINGDSKNPFTIYVYDATAKSWSAQNTTTKRVSGGGPQFDPTNVGAILDHDTNVFYAYSNKELFRLDMALLKSASPKAIPWVDVQTLNFDSGKSTDSYQPVMALAQNHVHFLGVPGIPAGEAKIFVIHYAFMQPDPQLYTGTRFPTMHGRTASFFKETDVQTKFAFIPDDGSATYVIDVLTNTTQTFTGPTIKDSSATYAASTSALVQLSSAGVISWIGYDAASSSSTAWATVKALPENLRRGGHSTRAVPITSITSSYSEFESSAPMTKSGGSRLGGMKSGVGWVCIVVGPLVLA